MVLSQLLPSLGFDGFPWEKAAHGPDLEGFQPLPKDRGGSGCGMWSFKSLLEHRVGQRSVNTAMNLGAHGSVQLCLTWKNSCRITDPPRNPCPPPCLGSYLSRNSCNVKNYILFQLAFLEVPARVAGVPQAGCAQSAVL